MFRFTIRDLLWLTVVVALGVAWWLDQRALRDQLDSQTEAIRTVSVDIKQARLKGMHEGASNRNQELENENENLRQEVKLLKKAYLGHE